MADERRATLLVKRKQKKAEALAQQNSLDAFFYGFARGHRDKNATPTMRIRGHRDKNATTPSMRMRDIRCVRAYARARRTRQVDGNVSEVLHALNATAEWWPPAEKPVPWAEARSTLAVLVRGQTYRGQTRESFTLIREPTSASERYASQAKCARSLVEHLIEPFERAGHAVSVFLTIFASVWGDRSALVGAFAPRVVSVSTLQHNSTASQILSTAMAVRDHLAWCERYHRSFDAVVVTRFDAFFKSSLHALLGDASAIDGMRFLWRETGGHWRHHANPNTVKATFATAHPITGRGTDWRKDNFRVPDALLAFPGGLTRCFVHAALDQLYPSPKFGPVNFLHHTLAGMRREAWEEFERAKFVVSGAFDSNPCRATCMLNPVYDLLPRMRWVTDSGICQRPSDFQFDTKSQSHCCPSPNYCCPNSVTNCGAAGARLFDVRDTVSDDAIATLFPLGQNAPYEWEMTERSFVHVATVWRRVARRSWREQRYEESALKMLHGAFSRGRISKDGWRSFALNATKPFRDGGKLLAPYGRVAAFARDVYCSTKGMPCDFGPIQPPISA